MRRGTIGLIGAILLVCGVVYIFVRPAGSPPWPGVVLIVVGFAVIAGSNTRDD